MFRRPTPPGHYHSASKRKPVPITEMHADHLANAIAKIERNGGDNETYLALKAEKARRGG